MRKVLFVLAAILTAAPGVARELAGVDVPEVIRMQSGGGPMHLAGASVQRHNFMPFYVTALYLSPNFRGEIPDEYTQKQVTLIWLTPQMSDERVDDYWRKAMAESVNDQQLYLRIESAVDRFVDLFEGVAHGDRFEFEYVPDMGTQVVVNGTKAGIIPGIDFHRALMGVWLGDKSRESVFQAELLGKS